MQGRIRRVRIQHAQPWLVESLDLGGRKENAVPGRLPPLVIEWAGTLATSGTRRAYLSDVQGFLDRVAVSTDDGLLGVRVQQVATWRDFLAGELEAGRLSYQSCKRRMAAASSLYDYLNHQGHVIVNPVRRVKRPEAERGRDRRPPRPACSSSHCPATTGNPVPELLAKLARPQRQLALFDRW